MLQWRGQTSRWPGRTEHEEREGKDCAQSQRVGFKDDLTSIVEAIQDLLIPHGEGFLESFQHLVALLRVIQERHLCAQEVKIGISLPELHRRGARLHLLQRALLVRRRKGGVDEAGGVQALG